MHPFDEHHLNLTRRQFFGTTGLRLGGAALAMLGASRIGAAEKPAHASIRRCRGSRTSRRRPRRSSTCT